jgi:site-specific DNA-methyltransferase (adenine-specific)
MKEAYRVLKQDRLAAIFYGWGAVDKFFAEWRQAGFYPVGHIVFRKDYAPKSRMVRYQHKQAYLLTKGKPPLPLVSGYKSNRFNWLRIPSKSLS